MNTRTGFVSRTLPVHLMITIDTVFYVQLLFAQIHIDVDLQLKEIGNNLLFQKGTNTNMSCE